MAVPVVGGILLLLLAVVLIVFLGLRPLFSSREPGPGMPLEVVKLTPTVTSAVPTPPLPSSCETIVGSGDVQVAVSLPISLTVGGESFPVVAIDSPSPPIQGGGWIHPSGYPGSATWVCGTVVNYVMGLEPKPENEALLVASRPGDEIKIHLSNGTELFFRFVERWEADANDARVFEQARPRMTLVVEREDGTWQVATADYVSETESVQPPSGALSQPGEQVRVGDAQVTVIRGHAERDGADLLPGTMYYLVEFSVENVGTAVLDATTFNMQLWDAVGNEYLLSSEASTFGEYGPLGDEIGPGITMQGTAGYLVPETLAGPALTWTFTPQPGSELRASVSIPYETDAQSPSPGQANVTIDEDSTFVSSDGDFLVIGGEVRNTGGEPLTVELSDINLTSSAGMGALRSAAPPLPWTIQPGQAQIIELQYEKPDASTVLLVILGYSFEIRGLQ